MAEGASVTLCLARLKPAVRATLDLSGGPKRIGPDRIHGNIHRVVQAELAAPWAPEHLDTVDEGVLVLVAHDDT